MSSPHVARLPMKVTKTSRFQTAGVAQPHRFVLRCQSVFPVRASSA